MKLLSTVLLASLALNATLAYVALTGRARLADDSATDPTRSTLGAPRAASPGSAPIDPATWSQLQTDDLAALATRLRAAGFSPDMIRAMLSGLLTEQFAARRRALDPDSANRPFWKDRAPDLKLQLAQFQLSREQENALRALLGPDARNSDPLALARLRSRLGNLPPDKMDAAQLILEDYDQKRTEFYFTKGTMSQTDLAPLERELRTALAAVLSPAELEEYDLRNSTTGRTLRNDLIAFNPTEEEFRAIYKLRQPFDELYSYNSGIPSQEQMKQRTEAQKQLTAQIAAQLGAERAADYERSTDYDYRRTAQLVARLELPAETTVALWNTQKEFEKRRGEIYATGPATPPEARNQQLTALQQEAIAKITPLLGGNASRVTTYKQYGGSWLDYLVPRPAPGR